MSAGRDDFGIAFRSALLQKGAAQKFSLISLIILAIIIFFLDVYNFAFIKPARYLINDGIYRVSLVASTPTKFFPILSNELTSLIYIKEENERLRKEIEIYKNTELNIEYLTSQNKVLQQLLDSEGEISLSENKLIVAKVLLDKDSPYLKSVIINKGSKSGVLKGMPALVQNYLVGRVVETNYLSARVLLLNDLNSRVPVTIDSNGTQAILKGNGTLRPQLEYLPEEYVIQEGVNVFTSGKDQIFKAGTPIGVTDKNGSVKLFIEPNQISFIKINLTNKFKESF